MSSSQIKYFTKHTNKQGTMSDNQPKQDSRFGPPMFELSGLAYQISMLNIIINKRELLNYDKRASRCEKTRNEKI